MAYPSNSESVAQDQLQAFFERWQRLEDDKRAVSDDLKELFAEAKGFGFDTKVMRKVFRDKTADAADRAEFEAIYDLYFNAIEVGTDYANARVTREEPVQKQEGDVEGEGQAGVARELGSGEPSQPLLPSDRVDETPDAPAVVAGVPITEAQRIMDDVLAKRKPIRPHCLKPEMCAGQGRQHCYACQRAHAEAEGFTA